jgi:L-lactate dehydrogenase (cytochrome)
VIACPRKINSMITSSALDFREAARRRLPRFLFDYADGGAGSEHTLRRNVSDLEDVSLRSRVLKGVDDANLETTLFGVQRSMPVMLGPIGIAGMFRRRGEIQAAGAAKTADIPFTVSTASLCSLCEVARMVGNSHLWLQLYVVKDRAFMRDLLAMASELGVKALVFTVDMPVPGTRYRDSHSGMSGPGAAVRRAFQAMCSPRWAWDVGLRGRPHHLGNLQRVAINQRGFVDNMAWLSANFDPYISWKDLDWIRSVWHRPLIIKGILDPDDSKIAADLGIEGIVVSNHGGRQLDGVLSSVCALPAIVDAVGHRLTVLADSGVRSGTDVVRMLALGARGVLLGRAWLFALAAEGGIGVTQLLGNLSEEMRVAMTLIGARVVGDITAARLATIKARSW